MSNLHIILDRFYGVFFTGCNTFSAVRTAGDGSERYILVAMAKELFTFLACVTHGRRSPGGDPRRVGKTAGVSQPHQRLSQSPGVERVYSILRLTIPLPIFPLSQFHLVVFLLATLSLPTNISSSHALPVLPLSTPLAILLHPAIVPRLPLLLTSTNLLALPHGFLSLLTLIPLYTSSLSSSSAIPPHFNTPN